MGMVLVLISVLSVISVAISEGACPERTFEIGDRFCLDLRPLTHDDDHKFYKNSFDKAEEWCRSLKTGGLKWSLPKIDTETKRMKIESELLKFLRMNQPRLHTHGVRSPHWIWLGMRRWQPPTYQDVDDESKWSWTRDNSTVKLRQSFNLFWQREEPSNDNGLGNETCAIAGVYQQEKEIIDGKKLLFASTLCQSPVESGNKRFEHPENMIAVACVAEMEDRRSITDEWWFQTICALLLLSPTVIVVIVFVVYWFRRLQAVSNGNSSENQYLTRQETKKLRGKADKKKKVVQESISEQSTQGFGRVGYRYVPPPMSSSSKNLDDENEAPIYDNMQ